MLPLTVNLLVLEKLIIKSTLTSSPILTVVRSFLAFCPVSTGYSDYILVR